ncbi:MAG: thioredoxin domain-containing protein [Hyphomicrobiaceae bacterium]|nr:thioredoxin domain-containing protein [Hyphomicrobiaceae bacterium]
MTATALAAAENRLGRETSPYLLQHKDNPVHWWAWGPDALAEAKRTGKPILLSVGYAACHWCHVMAHESFEDPAIAAQMNEGFVNIKVDREERPDIDAIYMRALHALGEHGGWPLTMFLDGDARPFWGGTYFPPEARFGRPSFKAVLAEVVRIYREEPDKIAHNADRLVQALRQRDEKEAAADLSEARIAALAGAMTRAVDMRRGGLDGAPKFPQWSYFWLLWRLAIRYGNPTALRAVDTTLTNICQGGIYDHLGGGFARYSVDERWLVPHFEKMLYDNALLIDLITEVYRETGSELYKTRIAETVGWLEREMIAEGGGFAASLDADSEGQEGKFYVWSKAEIEQVLGLEDAARFCAMYDATGEGNWEGHTILNRLGSLDLQTQEEEQALAAMRAKLLARRAGRVRPGWDDKVLADWNGLMIAGLAHAARVFDRHEWLKTANAAFHFVSTRMEKDGRLTHSWCDGRAQAPATASDYANMIWAALRLYQATDEDDYLGIAERWVAVVDEHYWVAEPGGYAFTADDTPDVIVRLRVAHDDAVPNANGIMLSNLVALHLLTGKPRYLEWAEAIPKAFAADLTHNTFGHCGLVAAALDLIAPQQVVTIEPREAGVPPGGSPLARAMFELSMPGAVEHAVGAGQGLQNPALAAKGLVAGRPTAYACLGPQCSLPVTEPEALVELLRKQRAAA